MAKDNKRFWYIQATKRRKAMETEAEAIEVLNELTNKEHMAELEKSKPLTQSEKLDKLYAINTLFVRSEHWEER